MCQTSKWLQARELVRLHTQLSDTAAGYQNEIQALIVVLFPEFTQVFADPCLPTALSVRNRLPECSSPGRSRCRTPFPVVTSTASSALRTRALPQRNWWPWRIRA
jgi:hypothetical protein